MTATQVLVVLILMAGALCFLLGLATASNRPGQKDNPVATMLVLIGILLFLLAGKLGSL